MHDTLLHLLTTNEPYKVAFSRSHPRLQKQKIALSEYYDYEGAIDKKIIAIIDETIYHDFRVVKNMYESSLSIKFPSIKTLYDYREKRHDLVHRNGKTKQGVRHRLEEMELHELLYEISKFITRLLVATDMFDLKKLEFYLEE